MKKLLLILSVIAIAASSCRFIGGRRIGGNGSITTQERTVSGFKNVEASGAVDVYISQGETKTVRIETDANLQEYIEVIQSGDKLIVRERKGYNLQPTDKVKIYITAPVYGKIEVSGASNIFSQSKINNSEGLKLEVGGAGEIKMELNAPSLDVEATGASSISLKGETKTLKMELTGASSAHCFELLSETTDVDITGAGDADVYASVKLKAEVSGAGSISYKGNATDVSQHVSGAGSIKKVD
jgi:hypothetical protein